MTEEITDEEFYTWKTSASEEGLISDAAFSYYVQDSKYLYAVFVDGTPVTAPVFTFRTWLTDEDIDTPLAEFDKSKSVLEEYDEDLLQELARQIAFSAGEDPDNAQMQDYLWNSPVYAVTKVDRDNMEFSLTVSDYFTTRQSAFELEEELAQGLFKTGITPDTKFIDIRQSLNEFTPEYRNKYAENFNQVMNFEAGPSMAGGAALTFFNTEDGYVFPVAKRSKDVAEARGWMSPVPSGVFQPYRKNLDEIEAPSLREHLLKEFSEYFFNTDPRDSIPTHLDGMAELESLLESGDAEIRYTSSGIDCKNTHVQFNGVLTIDDESYFHEYIENADLDSWEYESIEFVSIDDGDRIKELLHKSNMNPYDIVCLSEGLQWIERYRNQTLPIDLRPSSSHRHSQSESKQ